MVASNNSIPLFKPIQKDKDDQNDNHETPTSHHYNDNNHHRSYEPNGKVMLTAIISLSVVVLFVLALHIFSRCILRRNSGHRRRPETHHRLSFSLTDPLPPPDNKTGLDAAAIAALPISAFKPTSSGDEDCSVCLGILAEGEPVRLLPSCCHVFHVDCVDTWLAAQPTCPICRAEVESPPPLPPPPPPAAEGPSAPPLNSSSSLECGDSNKVLSSSRLSSFRRILSRERSSRSVVQSSLGQDQDFTEDLERQ